MPTLTIDNQEITVPAGSNVLEAAKMLGIVIPHFCYHEALGAVGACRLCAMAFLDGPVKGLQMSCMIEAQDGMVVSTVDDQAQEMRRHVIEWLMINHPHDCPVCDEGGECQLQDMTIAGGHSIRRFRGKKRTYTNQDLGPFIVQEMNRCIQCYRCVRTYQDYCGGDDFGVLGSRDRLFFGRFRDGRLESPFSGNIVDVCPTGVFTDKTFRYKSRYWDLEEAPSICPHCSLGCATIPGGRYRELQRVRAGANPRTNGFFICDRGRFGYDHVNHPERPRIPRIDGSDSSWDKALPATRERLKAIREEHGPGSIAFVGSGRNSLEGAWLLRQWARELDSDQFCTDTVSRREQTAGILAEGLGDMACSLEQVRGSDFILFVGADPLAEGPMAALAARQAVRAGAKAAVVDPRPVDLPFSAPHLPVSPERLPEVLEALSGKDFTGFDRRETHVLEGIAERLRKAERPVLIGGGDLLGPRGTQRLLSLAAGLANRDRAVGVMTLLSAPNSLGLALLAEERTGFSTVLQKIEEGHVRALVCLEADPLEDADKPGRVSTLLRALEALVVIDSLPTAAVRRADIFLPARATAESDGSYVNNEGRILPFCKVLSPGTPLSVSGDGDHPPRIFEKTTPGSQPMSSWALLDAVMGESRFLTRVREALEDSDRRFAGLSVLPQEGLKLRMGISAGSKTDITAEKAEGLRLLPTEALFGTEVLSSHSRHLSALTDALTATLHSETASELGQQDGDAAVLSAAGAQIGVTLKTCDTMAAGIIVVPRLRGSDMMRLVPGEPVPCRLGKREAS